MWSTDMALKIDIRKPMIEWTGLIWSAYSLNWNFFFEKWVGWMIIYIRSLRYSIQVNNDLVGPIIMGRGHRQGDPLSPYLFILCTEELSTAMNNVFSNRVLHGLRVTPAISHLLFANDSLLFSRATPEEG